MSTQLRSILLGVAAIVLLADLIPALAFLAALFDDGLTPSLADRDFVNYWMGSHLALAGEQADLFSQREYFARLVEEFGPQAQIRAWSYPPHILLPLFPLGYLPYEPALVLFLFLTLVLFVAAAEVFRRAEIPQGDCLVAFAAIAAYATVNLGGAQNGFLTGALLLSGLAWRGKRPLLAGIAFGLLTVKPQLGLLVPLLLLVERDWATILWSAVATLALVALSILVFGVDVWHAYLTVTVVEQRSVLTDWSGVFLYMMPTVFGAVRSLGADPSLAALLQWPVSGAALLACIWLFRRDGSRPMRAFSLLCATFLVSPYGFDYDMGALAVVAALLLARQGAGAHHSPWALAVIAILPAFVLPLGAAGAPVAPVLLAAALWGRLRETSPAEPESTR